MEAEADEPEEEAAPRAASVHIEIADTVAPVAPVAPFAVPGLNGLARPRAEIVAVLNAAAIALHAAVLGDELLIVAERAYRVVCLGGAFANVDLSHEMRVLLNRATHATNANGGGQMRALLLMAMSAIRTIGGQPVFARTLLAALMPVSTGQLTRAREILRGAHLREF